MKFVKEYKGFKVGDRVKVVDKLSHAFKHTGVIYKITEYGKIDLIIDDKDFHGHKGTSMDDSMNHWYVIPEYIEKIMNTKYEVGDVVKVISCLDGMAIYGGVRPSSQMLTKAGQSVKIKSVTKTGRYKIEGSCFTWTDEMFEDQKVEPTKKREPKVGDRIRMKDDFDFAKVGMTGVIKSKQGHSFAVEFDSEFEGGHTCYGITAPRRGQFIIPRWFEIIDTPKYSIATVTFDNDKEYCYLCDISVKKGDKVVVPCGSCDRETIATVVKTGKYTKEKAPYPVDKMKKVIRKGIDTKPTSENGFDWDKFKKTEIIVHCRTQKSWDNFLEECEKRDIKWVSNDVATCGSNYWSIYKDESSIVYGLFHTIGMSYTKLDHHRNELTTAAVYDWTSKKYTNNPIEEKKVEDTPTYKVGDRVEIRNDLVVGESYGGLDWFNSMDKLLSGKIFTIGEVHSRRYRLNDDNGPCYFVSHEMIKGKAPEITTEKVETKPTPKIEVGDVVRAIDNYYVITRLKDEWEGIVIATTNDEFTALTTHEKNSNHASYTRFYDLDPKHFEIIKKNT